MSRANLERLVRVARQLQSLEQRVVFVGGATIGLYLNPRAAVSVRATKDVDCIIDVTGRAAWANLESKLRAMDFRNDTSQDAPICRWLLDQIPVDIMPPDAATLGFANRHYRQGIEQAASRVVLGVTVNVLTPMFAVLTKIDAYYGRGAADPFESKDLEDLVAFLDSGIPAISEVRLAPDTLRNSVQQFAADLLSTPSGIDLVEAHMPLGPRYDQRVDKVWAHLKALRDLR